MRERFIKVSIARQTLCCFEDNHPVGEWLVSTAKNGPGEQMGSECTPRGWHRVHALTGLDAQINSVFISRVWTGEIYNEQLAQQYPERDWILTRIIQLDGLEPGFNKGGAVDSLNRYIYIHGTPDSCLMGKPMSHGCIRMRNSDIIELCSWVQVDTRLFIE